ncbi:MAG: hypothetical protein PHR57_00035 [Patescibacteria group bacterium]|nr:hypothetical protein [Patescibacteria group bacterium]
MKNFFKPNKTKFILTFFFLFLLTFFNYYYTLHSGTGEPKQFFLDIPINFIAKNISYLFSLIARDPREIGSLIIGSFVAAFLLILNLFYYYSISSGIYWLIKKFQKK